VSLQLIIESVGTVREANGKEGEGLTFTMPPGGKRHSMTWKTFKVSMQAALNLLSEAPAVVKAEPRPLNGPPAAGPLK
jgi:hypothetical protein